MSLHDKICMVNDNAHDQVELAKKKRNGCDLKTLMSNVCDREGNQDAWWRSDNCKVIGQLVSGRFLRAFGHKNRKF